MRGVPGTLLFIFSYQAETGHHLPGITPKIREKEPFSFHAAWPSVHPCSPAKNPDIYIQDAHQFPATLPIGTRLAVSSSIFV